MIISASRRTDIPAFYTEWFLNRIKAGYLLTRNPFNANQIKKISLAANDVEAFVFWTRNPEKLIKHLKLIDSMGYKYYFQYTITGYPRLIEKSVPNPHKAIATFIQLSDLIGQGRVIWRYDPILLSNVVGLDEHKRIFSKIASMLHGKTKRVVISFADIYKKTMRNLDALNELVYSDIIKSNDELFELSSFIVETASKHGMEVETCSEDIELSKIGIGHGKCIDDEILKREFGIVVPSAKDVGQREACGCIKSIDIGQYNTCLHGCSYCYATYNSKIAIKNMEHHDPCSPFLIGNLESIKAIDHTDSNPTIQQGALF